jgi:hypothetical protein
MRTVKLTFYHCHFEKAFILQYDFSVLIKLIVFGLITPFLGYMFVNRSIKNRKQISKGYRAMETYSKKDEVEETG